MLQGVSDGSKADLESVMKVFPTNKNRPEDEPDYDSLGRYISKSGSLFLGAALSTGETIPKS